METSNKTLTQQGRPSVPPAFGKDRKFLKKEGHLLKERRTGYFLFFIWDKSPETRAAGVQNRHLRQPEL